VVNEGIGGNQVIGPARYTPSQPFVGGPAAEQRLNRDAIDLSGVSTVIFMEGINDIGKTANAKPEAVEAGMKRIVARLRKNIPGVRIIGVTLTPDLHSTNPDHGSATEDAKRKDINTFIRTSRLFDGVFDFSRVVGDKNTGGLRPEFIPDSTIGGPGDGLHPDHAGYQAMADSIDLKTLKPPGSSASH
jgi:lysophospholipase L1-like esterase